MTPSHLPPISKRVEAALILCITLLAFTLRSVGHWSAPRGWREDELSNALVVSQHVLDGELRLYYDDASGHEGLYHWLQAGAMAVFGPGVWGIRGVSILLGTLGVLLTYLLARRLYDWPTAALAALLLAVSFWSLMYSRSGQRHISVTTTTLLSFYFLWRAIPTINLTPDLATLSLSPLQIGEGEGEPPLAARKGVRSNTYHWRDHWLDFALAGLSMGTGFYTYFASRGVPLIVIGWAAYLLIWQRDLLRRIWPGLLVMLAIALLLAVPLGITLQRQPEAEARVAELARPVYDARQGDFSTLADYTLTTLSMFTHNGDDEVLYNVPNRPVFGILGGVLFWAGVILALIQSFGPQRDPRPAFLLLWLGAGLTPGALSVPAASLGHTILAQPVAMIFPGLLLFGGGAWLGDKLSPDRRQLLYHDSPLPNLRSRSERGLGVRAIFGRGGSRLPSLVALGFVLATILLIWEGVRGIRDYWFIWPDDDFNRVNHHSDLHEAASWLNAHAANRHVAIGGFLNERWDRQVMLLDLEGEGWQIRAFDPRDAYLMLPDGGTAVLPAYLSEGWGVDHLGQPLDADGPYTLYQLAAPDDLSAAPPIAHFDNGLSLIQVDFHQEADTLVCVTGWRVDDPLDLPPFPLLSKPPAPDEDDTPRLAIFIQLLDESGQRAAGVDSLSVDPYTLLVGDVFFQRSLITLDDLPSGTYRLITGLYDPATGQRRSDLLTGSDHVDLGLWP